MSIEQALLYLTEEGYWSDLDKAFGKQVSKIILSDVDLTSKQRRLAARKLKKYRGHFPNWRALSKNLSVWKLVKVTKSHTRLPRLDFDGKNFLLYVGINQIEIGRLLPKGRRNSSSLIWKYPSGSEFVRTLVEDYPDFPGITTSDAFARIYEKMEQLESKKAGLDRVQEIKDSDTVDYTLTLKTAPYDHQKKAMMIGTTLDRTALLMEQGTGKTLAAIGIATQRYLQGQVKRILIVAPKSVLPEWAMQFEDHTDLPYQAQALDMRSKGKRKIFEEWVDIKNGVNVITLNYESLATFSEELIMWKPDMMILDESQKIKNPHTSQAKASYDIAEKADVQYRLILTGTPVSESPLDFFGQYRFLDPSIFGYSFTDFKKHYAEYDYRGFKIKYLKNQEELASKAHGIAFRVTKQEANLNLPKETYIKSVLPMVDSERILYNNMEDDSIINLSDEATLTAPLLITQLIRLQQITGGFIKDEDGTVHKVGDAKLKALRKVLAPRFKRKQKTVIFCKFTPEIEAIHKYLERKEIKHEVLSGSTKDRGKVLTNFKNDPDSLVFLTQIRAGGVGITLTSADLAIFYSTGYSLIDYEQAKARIHRIGQTKDVTYLHLIAKKTIDEIIYKALRDKKDIADLFVDQMKYINSKLSKGANNTMASKLDKKLNKLKIEMEKGEIDMTAKDLIEEEIGTEEETAPKKKGKGKGKGTKASKEAKETKTPKEAKEPKAKKPKKEKEDKGPIVNVAMIAEEIGVEPSTLRRQLRNSGLEKQDGRWEWPEGHEDIDKVKKLKGDIDAEKVAVAERKAAKAAAKAAKEAAAEEDGEEEVEAPPKKKKKKKKAAPVVEEEDDEDDEDDE